MWNRFFDRYLGEELTLDMRLFHVTFLIASLTCIIGAINMYFRQAPLILIIVVGGMFACFVLLYKIICRKEQFRTGCYIVVLAISIIVYPILFITCGGIDSGMSSFGILLIVMTYFVSDSRKKMVSIIILQIVLLIILIMVEYYHPEFTIPIKSLKYRYIDILNSIIIAAVGIGTLVSFQSRVYLKERQKVEKAILYAKEANKAKSLFLANMSHEIRTPMNVIIGMLELIVREDISDEVREKAGNIQVASISLLAIINDILDFSKIESGKVVITLERYQFSTVITDITHMIATRLAEKDVEFFVHIDPKIPCELMGDHVRIRQILINLLNNAVKFTESGSISLSVGCRFRQDSVFLFINVMDTGIGIKEENIERIFRSFEQVDDYEQRNIEGTGLGLSICKQLLELMGGSISVKSTYGKGSTFSVLLPQKIINNDPIIKIDHSIKRKILILEKTRQHAEVLRQLFVLLDIETIVVKNLEELKETMKKEEYTNLFIAKGMFLREEEFIRKNSKNMKICVLIGYGSPMQNYGNVMILRRPICYISMEAILNGDDSKLNCNQVSQYKRFTAYGAEILVIDDNRINLEVIRGLLQYYKINVTVAGSGKEGLDLLKNPKYNLVLLDYMMPDIDGIETLRLIRVMEGTYYKKLPVIALTANVVSGAKEMFLNTGFQDYVAKPIEILKLEMVLLKYLPSEKLQISNGLPNEKIDNVKEEIHIPKIIAQEGIKNCNGDVENYINILKIVAREGKEKCETLKKYLDEEDYERYIIEVHGIKGAMMSVGAMELGEIAKRHEMSGKEENYEFIHDNIEAFTRSYKLLVQNIEAFLEEKEEKSSIGQIGHGKIDKEYLLEEFRNTEQLLENFESSLAEEKISQLLSYEMDEELRRYIENLKRQIEELEYEEAIKLIQSYIQEGR